MKTHSKSAKVFQFQKEEDNKWYIVLPEWEGDKSELEMVCGADTMLDIISQGETTAHVLISEQEFNGAAYTLSFLQESNGGADYLLDSDYYRFDVWLCHVTKFVFGYFPPLLYLK